MDTGTVEKYRAKRFGGSTKKRLAVVCRRWGKSTDARLMRCYPVSTRINHVANDDEECSKPVELAQIQNGLFS